MLNKAAIEGLRRFLKHAEALKPQNNPQRENGFAKEFQEIKDLSSRLKKDPAFSTRHGEKDINRPKNRYRDILPYDYSRIILPAKEGVDGSDYINGNYIKGPSDEVLYLAAQGPLPITVNDFWKMIISHQTQVIVMACREYELGKLKCKRYWPEKPDEKLTFDTCVVSQISQEEMGDGFIIRTLSAKHANGELKVTQFHYTAWPDHDVPRSATPLIELTMSFRAFVGNENNVPVLVHCSAGCGRTGTICALDYALSLIKLGRTDDFSVFDIVSTLRRQRIAMVQTKEQYELVYKAVKEIVSNELLKQRSSMHTYVNVAVGEEMPEAENTYENVEFIRSIQRLHEEEKNASRRHRELPSKAIVVAPSKDVVLAPQQNNAPQRSQPDLHTNQRKDKNSSNQLQERVSANQSPDTPLKVSKNNLQQPTSKPPLKKKPQSGYENVLPLSLANAAPKPPLVPKPQNYVNVAIGTPKNDSEGIDYVNVPTSVVKTVPVPEKKNELVDKLSKPVPAPFAAKPQMQAKPVPPHPSYQRKASLNGKNDDYVIPPLPKKEEKESDYVISQSFSTNVNTKIVPEGNLLEMFDSGPSSLPNLRRASSEHEVQLNQEFKPLDPSLMVDLSRSSPSLQSKDSEHHQTNKKQSRTTERLSIPGQYSLVGAFEGSESPDQSDIRDPFENAPKIKGRSSFGTVESVVADSGPVKQEKPVATPRRASEVSPNLKRIANQTSQGKPDTTQVIPQGKSVIGTYSMVDIPNVSAKSSENHELLIDLTDETKKESIGSVSNTPNLSNRRFQKSYSTEDILSSKTDLYAPLHKCKGATTDALTKRPSLDSSGFSNYSLATVPLTRRSSEDVLNSKKSSLYASADREAPIKTAADLSFEEKIESGDVLGTSYPRKKPVGVRRSNSGVTSPSVNFSERPDIDSLYATVGAKSRDKRRTPISADIWSNESSPASSLDRHLNRSNNSNSSLRSINSTSSNDSLEDAPPIPMKTADAFTYPEDDDAYEAVQKSSTAKTTLNRFKSRAKNMMTSGPYVSKLSSLGKRNASSTDSLASSEGPDFYTSDKGYRSRVGKPLGPRQCPSHWPKFAK